MLDKTARRSNQSFLKEINPEYSLEGLMLKLKLQYFGHLIRRADLLEKTLTQGKTEAGRQGDDRGWDGWMASLTQWTWAWANSRRQWRTGKPGVLQSMGSQRVNTTERRNNKSIKVLQKWNADKTLMKQSNNNTVHWTVNCRCAVIFLF